MTTHTNETLTLEARDGTRFSAYAARAQRSQPAPASSFSPAGEVFCRRMPSLPIALALRGSMPSPSTISLGQPVSACETISSNLRRIWQRQVWITPDRMSPRHWNTCEVAQEERCAPRSPSGSPSVEQLRFCRPCMPNIDWPGSLAVTAGRWALPTFLSGPSQ